MPHPTGRDELEICRAGNRRLPIECDILEIGLCLRKVLITIIIISRGYLKVKIKNPPSKLMKDGSNDPGAGSLYSNVC